MRRKELIQTIYNDQHRSRVLIDEASEAAVLMLDLKNIESFVWVAQLGGFGVAAQRLNTTQSTISQRIDLLERHLGTKLLDRNPKRTVPNAKGRELLPYAEQMLRLRSEMLKVAGSAEAFRGHIRLGTAETIVHTKLIKFVEKLRATYPLIALDIEVDISKNLRDDLLNGSLDMVILSGAILEPNVCNLDYVKYPMAWVASPKLGLPANGIPLCDIAQYPVITYSKGTRPYLSIRDMILRAGVTDFRIYGNTSLATIVRLCVEGIGVSCIPPVVISRELENKELTIINVIGGELPDLQFTLSYMLTADVHLLEAIATLAREL
jgi:DNA-binding transcriptional LysR family regulator